MAELVPQNLQSVTAIGNEASTEVEVLSNQQLSGEVNLTTLEDDPRLNDALADLGTKIAEVVSIPSESWPTGRRVKLELVFRIVPASITATIENIENK